MKRYAYPLGFLAVVCIVGLAYCTGRSAGSVSVEDKTAKREADSLRKVAASWMEQAEQEKAMRFRLLNKLNLADSLLKVRGVSLIKATQKYESLRDSVLKAPQHTDTENSIIAAADSALSAASQKDSAQSAKIVLLESDTASKAREIFALRNVVSIRDQEISSLNKRMSLASKRVSNARKQGWIQGGSAVAFGILFYKASQ